MDNELCPLCKNDPETSDHIFANCCVAMEIRRKINSWWNVLEINGSCLQNTIVQSVSNEQTSGTKDIAKEVVWHAYRWAMWKLRNEVLFHRSPINPGIIANDIQSVSFFWFHNRYSAGRLVSWNDWCCNSFPV